MPRHVITPPGFGALKGFSASGWAGPGADSKISAPHVAAWNIVPGPTRGVDVATTWRHRRHMAPLQHCGGNPLSSGDAIPPVWAGGGAASTHVMLPEGAVCGAPLGRMPGGA